jgi:hypothetical protein
MSQQPADAHLPVVIFHRGNQEYFQECVRLNSQRNAVIVIGDGSNAHLARWPDVEHIDAALVGSAALDQFKKHFVNYSTNKADYELLCFARVFHLQQLMEQRGLDAVFHLDSDCLLLARADHIAAEMRKTHAVAYSLERLPNEQNPFKMSASIHNGLVTLEFCRAFAQLCFEIYVDKSKFHLIKPKIDWHTQQRKPGGICDMTLYYLLASSGTVAMRSTLDLFEFEQEPATLDHNINVATGHHGADSFVMQRGRKKVIKEGDRYYFVDRQTNQRVRTLSLHFQGSAKPLLKHIHEHGNV